MLTTMNSPNMISHAQRVVARNREHPSQFRLLRITASSMANSAIAPARCK